MKNPTISSQTQYPITETRQNLYKYSTSQHNIQNIHTQNYPDDYLLDERQIQNQYQKQYIIHQQKSAYQINNTKQKSHNNLSYCNKNYHCNSNSEIKQHNDSNNPNRCINKQYKTSSNIAIQQNKRANKQNNKQLLHTFYNPTKQFIRLHKPFLENKKIIFNIKCRNNNNKTIHLNKNIGHYITHHYQENHLSKCILKQSNIQKLKRQILELDKEDFVSYRSKSYFNSDQIKVIQNQKINKYNHQNSMIIQWKGKGYFKPCIIRPSSTMTINNLTNNGLLTATPKTATLSNYIGFSTCSSAPKKYFSKPKVRHILSTQDMQINCDRARIKQTPRKMVTKTEQIAIGLNMFRGKLTKRKTNNSCWPY